jgi:hypothetical protein
MNFFRRVFFQQQRKESFCFSFAFVHKRCLRFISYGGRGFFSVTLHLSSSCFCLCNKPTAENFRIEITRKLSTFLVTRMINQTRTRTHLHVGRTYSNTDNLQSDWSAWISFFEAGLIDLLAFLITLPFRYRIRAHSEDRRVKNDQPNVCSSMLMVSLGACI